MQTERNRSTAITLMRMALGLLDQNGELLAAARLQHAIDTLDGEQPTKNQPDIPPELLNRILGTDTGSADDL